MNRFRTILNVPKARFSAESTQRSPFPSVLNRSQRIIKYCAIERLLCRLHSAQETIQNEEINNENAFRCYRLGCSNSYSSFARFRCNDN
jgi:hypothetical protein